MAISPLSNTPIKQTNPHLVVKKPYIYIGLLLFHLISSTLYGYRSLLIPYTQPLEPSPNEIQVGTQVDHVATYKNHQWTESSSFLSISKLSPNKNTHVAYTGTTTFFRRHYEDGTTLSFNHHATSHTLYLTTHTPWIQLTPRFTTTTEKRHNTTHHALSYEFTFFPDNWVSPTLFSETELYTEYISVEDNHDIFTFENNISTTKQGIGGSFKTPKGSYTVNHYLYTIKNGAHATGSYVDPHFNGQGWNQSLTIPLGYPSSIELESSNLNYSGDMPVVYNNDSNFGHSQWNTRWETLKGTLTVHQWALFASKRYLQLSSIQAQKINQDGLLSNISGIKYAANDISAVFHDIGLGYTWSSRLSTTIQYTTLHTYGNINEFQTLFFAPKHTKSTPVDLKEARYMAIYIYYQHPITRRIGLHSTLIQCIPLESKERSSSPSSNETPNISPSEKSSSSDTASGGTLFQIYLTLSI